MEIVKKIVLYVVGIAVVLMLLTAMASGMNDNRHRRTISIHHIDQ